MSQLLIWWKYYSVKTLFIENGRKMWECLNDVNINGIEKNSLSFFKTKKNVYDDVNSQKLLIQF